jgi:hypothetical protein
LACCCQWCRAARRFAEQTTKDQREAHGRADLLRYIGIHTWYLRDRPSSAHPVTTITPPHGDRRHYAPRANPNKDDAYDLYHLHEPDVARQAPPGPLIPATRTLALVLRIQWRYDKAKEIAGQIEALYVDGAAGDIRRTARARQHSRRQTAANEEVGEQQSSSRNRRPVEKPKWSNP